MACKYDDYDWDEVRTVHNIFYSPFCCIVSLLIVNHNIIIQLPAEVQAAAAKLGFNKALWDADKEPKECDVYWRKLSEEQKEAAKVLGYDEKSWDAS